MRNFLLVLTVLLSTGGVFSQVEIYQKFEEIVSITDEYENPYNYREVSIKANFRSPSDSVFIVDGFYVQDYLVDTVTGALQPQGDGSFNVRFAPNEEGLWSYDISKEDSLGVLQLKEGSFTCTAANSSANHGFVRVDSSHYLKFDDGEQYIVNGENMAWQLGNVVTNYRAWVGRLAQFKGNFIRLWHAHWGLGVEWRDGYANFDGLMQYNQVTSAYQDWLYEFCESRNVYAMLCLQHHGQVSTGVNPNWSDSPYNVANGGPCENTWDFFTDSTAIEMTKNRFRYIVARWGYSKNIMAWELFNEVEWTDNYEQHRDEIAEWHYEMSDFLKSIDPYQRIVTTSYAHADEDPLVWSNPNIDLSQTHYYTNISNIERVVSQGIKQYLREYEKPTLNGEFGLGGSSSFSKKDVDGIHLHNSMWASVLSGAIGTSMTWWWDSYIHPFDLYFHYEGIDRFTRRVPFVEKKLNPADSRIANVPGDLIFTPNVGWGASSTDTIRIGSNGRLTPEFYNLGLYLYGSVWNTQFRVPPVFEVSYQDTGYFELRTSLDKGNSPRILIMVDTFRVVDTLGVSDTTYTVKIPPGQHFITVDNPGIDWITISEYTFSDLGSDLDSYVLKSEEEDYAAGWILNHRYNHNSIVNMEAISEVSGAELQVPDFANGEYVISWTDCLSGELLSSEMISVDNSMLSVAVPTLLWDVNFVVDKMELVSTEDGDDSQNLTVYPNPAIAGTRITLSGVEHTTKVSLVDMSGRVVMEGARMSENSFTLPQGLIPGIYWVRVALDNQDFLVTPLSIVK